MLYVKSITLPYGTIGKLFYDGIFLAYTIERPWLNNTPRVSCVPAGEYKLEWHEPTSVSLPSGWKGTWALVNEDLGVSHYKKDDVPRSVCLFGHIANYPTEVRGCFGFGMSSVLKKNTLMVTSSRVAVEKVLSFIKDNTIDSVTIHRT